MKSILTAVLVAALAVPSLAGAEEDLSPTMNEVQAMMGLPTSHDSFTCGGGKDLHGDPIPRWPCVEWSYASEDGIIVLVFDAKTKRFGNLRAVTKDGSTVPYNERQEMLMRFVRVVAEFRAAKTSTTARE